MTRWARSGKQNFVDATPWDSFKESAPAFVRKRNADDNPDFKDSNNVGKRSRFSTPGSKNSHLNSRREKVNLRLLQTTCFNCRERGHDVKSCPDLINDNPKVNKVQEALNKAKLCYKCGETGHTTRDCSVPNIPQNSYPFADCFVCKSKGHLSSQCPDNPKGCYPKGGCCRRCQSVRHLFKDCPVKNKVRDEAHHAHPSDDLYDYHSHQPSHIEENVKEPSKKSILVASKGWR
eukprot:Sdes_comp18460_c0_seq1m8429